MRTLYRRLMAVAGTLLLASAARSEEIGFVEEFALAPDRAAAIQQLVPGTEEYYFYACLNFQNTGQIEAVDPLLTQWIKLHGETPRAREIRNRQMLLNYAKAPQATLDYIRQQEGLNFGHAREQSAPRNQYPAKLDPAVIARDALAKRAFAQHRNLNGFGDACLEWLAAQPLTPEQSRHLLQRLTRPDVPGLVTLIVADLRAPNSGGFGSLNIHRQLCLDQLDACAAQLPDLYSRDPFVESMAVRLQPDVESPWRWNTDERRAYLDRLWAFAAKLPGSQNSFKTHVLYHRLEFDRSQDQYDRARFTAYLQLPRNQIYVRPLYREQSAKAGLWQPADLQRDYAAWTGLGPVGNDEPLVRDYLLHFLVEAPDWNGFAEYVDETYAKELFAEAKILAGVGDPDQWYALLPPARHAALRDRVDLALLPQNPAFLDGDMPARLRVAVKNVPRLTVQIFEINAFNHFRDNEELTTAIDLDGLAPAVERTVVYAQPPLRRHVETLEFPEIKARGLYVVELIGNGVSSRAVIRKGRLFSVVRTGAAGHVFTVFNERREQVKDARLWVGGHEYAAEADGAISVPFRGTDAPPRPLPVEPVGRLPGAVVRVPEPLPLAPGRVLLRQGDFTDTGRFDHAAESYALQASFWVDREGLIAGTQATLLVRPELLCTGARADLALIEQPVLEVRAIDAEGIAVTQRKSGLQLVNDRELVHRFSVPEGTRRLEFRLSGKVRNVSLNRDDALEAGDVLALNSQDGAQQAAASYLRRTATGYLLEIRGKSGELRAGQVVNLDLRHRDFNEPVHAVLQTDDNGRIDLGPLADIALVQVNGPAGWQRTWPLAPGGRVAYPERLVVRRGEPLELPLPADAPAAAAQVASLLHLGARGLPVSDAAAHLRVANGALLVNDLAAGNYSLMLKPPYAGSVAVEVYDGPEVAGCAVAATRVSGRTPARLARLDALTVDEQSVRVHVANATPATRVHLLARWSCTDGLPPGLTPATREVPAAAWMPPQSLYVSGRNIGDEYRYVLDRRFAKRSPGNMLDRPSLLLNPWDVRDTSSGRQLAAAGEMYDAISAAEASELKRGGREAALLRYGGAAAEAHLETLDFLPGPALVVPNLVPDAEGNITLPRAGLGFRTQLFAALTDDAVWSVRELALPEAPLTPRDRALRQPLPADQHLAERKRVTPLATGATLTLDDIRSTRLDLYDSLAKVYRLFKSLADSPRLTDFAFVVEWPTLAADRQRELYSRHASHELNLFLYFKDRKFFDAVVKPFVAQKKEKQFIDDWLLERDLSRYLEPAAFSRLNACERVLLGKRIATQRTAIARHATDRADLVPFNPEEFNRRFLTALQGGGLDAAPDAGVAFGAEKSEAEVGMLAEGQAKNGKADEKGKALGGGHGVARALAAAAPAPSAPGAAPADALADREASALRKAGTREENAAAVPAEDLGRDKDRRALQRARFRSPDRTKEWVENQYYRLPLAEQVPALVPFNGFWRDYAAHDGKSPFLSSSLTDATASFAEMLLALAVLDLPFEPGAHAVKTDDTRQTLTAATPLLAFHQQVEGVRVPEGLPPLLVGQNVFAADDRYAFEGNERLDKFVTDEFVVGRVYGAQVVLTNPTGTRRKSDVLLQIPEGAVPVANGFYTRSVYLLLEPYATQTLEYYFYFPTAGDYRHYPVQASVAGELAGFAPAIAFHVVLDPTRADRDSWAYVSQYGSDEEVLAFLGAHNIDRLELVKIAFRLRDPKMFQQTLALLRDRHVYDAALWSYGILLRDVPAVREYLQNSRLAGACGRWLASELLTVDYIRDRFYEHKEYWPLVNARVHPLGARRQILNDGLLTQYREFMQCLCYKPRLDSRDRLAVAIYLLLQDRVDDAAALTADVKPADVEERLQLDYLRVYQAFSRSDSDAARKLAEPYRDYPVTRWRDLFRNALAQAEEAAGRAPAQANPDSRDQVQDQLAATAPSLDLSVEGAALLLRYRNLTECRINYYPMDLELLFSRSPFTQDVSRRFATIRAARSEKQALPAGKDLLNLRIPDEFRARNLMVEVEGGGAVVTQVYTPNTLEVRLVETYGQVVVRDSREGRPLAGVYVKAYARWKGGDVRFYKDGYTDLRGRFDYASLSTDDLDQVERFALLLSSTDAGATVREVAPPRK